MINRLFLLFVLLAFSCTAFSQTELRVLKDSIAQINRLWPAEKVYLHTDKPYYDVGDTIWIKAYVLDASSLTATKKSNFLYIELYNDTSEVVRRISIRLHYGLGATQIPLPAKNFQQGGYTLRAYTNWMQNFGTERFFERRLYLGSPLIPSTSTYTGISRWDSTRIALERKRILKTEIKDKPVIDLQFLPEGGQLIADIPTLLAFKAIGRDGKGTDVSGQITDSRGSVAATFKSSHLGMGSLLFTAGFGETYKASIKNADGSALEYKLPKVAAEGILLQLKDPPPQDSLRLQIIAKGKYLDLSTPYILIGSVRGEVYYSRKIERVNEQISISKKLFPSGVLKLRLFKGIQVLSNRSVFIDHQDRFQVVFKTDQSSYGKRDSILLTGIVSDKNGHPVVARLSVSVTDDGLVEDDKSGDLDIGTELLLRSDIKGKVESPGYYFNLSNLDRLAALDVLMLTQGWIGLSESVLSPPKETKYWAEQEMVLRGWVGSAWNKPVKSASVLISSQKPNFIRRTFSNANGDFQFDKLPPIDSGSFFIQAQTPTGKTKSFGSITLRKFSPAAAPMKILEPVLPWYANADTARIGHFKTIHAQKEAKLNPTGIMLKEVNIQTKKIIKNSRNKNGPGNADLVFTEKEIKESAVLDLYELLRQKLPGFKVTYKDTHPTMMFNGYYVMLKIDGSGLPMQLDVNPSVDDIITEMKEFKIANFKGLEVMYSRKYTNTYNRGRSRVRSYKPGESFAMLSKVSAYMDPPPGATDRYSEYRIKFEQEKDRNPDVAVIEITTANGRGWYKNTRPDYVTYRPVPIVLPLQFYQPLYKTDSSLDELDTRPTVYWKPSVVTNADGRFTIKFFNSDVSKNLTVTVQGADLTGRIGSGKAAIKTIVTK